MTRKAILEEVTELELIGGNVGGIRYQIDDGKNGFLVSSIEEAAKRIVQYLDLFNSFETVYRLKH